MPKPAAPAAYTWTPLESVEVSGPVLPVAFLPDASSTPISAADCPPDAVDRIRVAASRGGSLKALHALFGVAADVFKRWMDDDPDLRKAFEEGKEAEREALHRTMYEAAVFKRDLGAAQFLLKTRHGYREQEPDEARNSVRIVFNLPAAAPDLRTYEANVLPGVARRVDRE